MSAMLSCSAVGKSARMSSPFIGSKFPQATSRASHLDVYPGVPDKCSFLSVKTHFVGMHTCGLHHGICQTKTLPQAPAEPSPRHLTRQKPYHKHPRSLHQGICQDNNLTTSTRGAFTTAFAKTETLPQAPAEPSPGHLPRQKSHHKHPRSLHHGICQDKNLATSTRGAFTTAFDKTTTLPQAPAEPSPGHLPRQQPYHKHPRLLPRQKPYHKHPRSLHQGICQDKSLTTSTRGAFTTAFAKTKTLPQAPAEPSPRHLTRQQPYHKHPRSLHQGICQDNSLTTSTRGAFTRAFAKTTTLPQAPAEPSPGHLPRQQPYHKHPRSLHHGFCQDKNLATSTRGAFTTAFAQTKTLPQAPAEPSPRHLPRQKPYHKHPRSLHHGICQDKNLATSTRGAFTASFAKTKTLPQAPAEPSPRLLPKQKPYHKQARSLHHGICPDKNLTTSTRGAFTTVFAKTKTSPQAPVEPSTASFAKTKTSPQASAEPSPRHLPRQKPYNKHPQSPHRILDPSSRKKQQKLKKLCQALHPFSS